MQNAKIMITGMTCEVVISAIASGGGLGSVGESILQELRLLQEALGELKGLKEEF
jgi:hypothetical protein